MSQRIDIFPQTPQTNPRNPLPMNIHISLLPIVSLVAGVLILLVPRMLNYIVAFYLIAVGLIGLFGATHFFRWH